MTSSTLPDPYWNRSYHLTRTNRTLIHHRFTCSLHFTKKGPEKLQLSYSDSLLRHVRLHPQNFESSRYMKSSQEPFLIRAFSTCSSCICYEEEYDGSLWSKTSSNSISWEVLLTRESCGTGTCVLCFSLACTYIVLFNSDLCRFIPNIGFPRLVLEKYCSGFLQDKSEAA